jgi:hypothetical protein
MDTILKYYFKDKYRRQVLQNFNSRDDSEGHLTRKGTQNFVSLLYFYKVLNYLASDSRN